MTEPAVPTEGAGAMLRAAREAQGMHIAALAASIKIPQARLESLEAERYAELPDLAFTRALALRVCRALNIDAAPVLQRLPAAGPALLEKVDGGLNAPFRERFERSDSIAGAWLQHTATWVVALVLAGAAAVAFVPTQWLRSLTRGASSTPADAGAAAATVPSTAATSATAVSLPSSSVAGAIVETIDLAASAAAGVASAAAVSAVRPASELLANLAAAPVVLAAASVAPRAAAVVGANTAANTAAYPAANAAANPAANAASGVQLRATEASWVQVTNSRGRVVFGRMLAAGELVAVDGAPPMKIRIGNARGVELRLNGEQVNVAPFLRGNIANVVLR